MKYFRLIQTLFLLWIAECFSQKVIPEPKFHITPLGHTGLLIRCEIPNVPKDAPYVAEYTIEDAETSGRKEKYFTIGDFLSKAFLNLSPKTKYKIEVQVKHENLTKPVVTTLEAETNDRSEENPFKPDFEYELKPELYSYSKLTIRWLPCGKQQNCGNLPAGTHFYVKYQEKGQDDILINRDALVDEMFITGCRPGRVYKFVVVSVYEGRKVESDPQEITFPNAAPDLDFVEVLVGGNATIPCKLPKTSKSKCSWNFPTNFRHADQVIYLDDGDILIKGVSFSDIGNFECYVPNVPTKISFTTFLDVKDETTILNRDKFRTVEVQAGDSFEIPCFVKNDNSLGVFVDWLRNGKPIDFSSTTEYQKEKHNTLVIPVTSSAHSANYTCVAKTRLDSTSATLVLKVVAP